MNSKKNRGSETGFDIEPWKESTEIVTLENEAKKFWTQAVDLDDEAIKLIDNVDPQHQDQLNTELESAWEDFEDDLDFILEDSDLDIEEIEAGGFPARRMVVGPEEEEEEVTEEIIPPPTEKIEGEVRLYATAEEESDFRNRARRYAIPEEVVDLMYHKVEGQPKQLKYRNLTRLRGIGRRLRSGGMGEVFKADHIPLDIPAVIKIVKTPEEAREALKEKELVRIERELKALAKFNHPNVVRVYEGGFCEKGGFISQELIEGPNLEEVREQVSLSELLQIFISAARGLKAVHEAGIIHRDIKPANIIVSQDKHGNIILDKAKIIDFGLVLLPSVPEEIKEKIKEFAQSPQDLDKLERISKKITLAGGRVGTALFMSPEQAQGKEVSKSSDIFSLGSTFFKIISGSVPFEGSNRMEVMVNIASDEPSPELQEKIPKTLKKIISGMMQKNSELRPDDDQVIEQLEKIKNALAGKFET